MNDETRPRTVDASRKPPATAGRAGLNFREFVGRRPPQIDWLWPGYLARANVTLLTSQWKTGKTTLLSVLLARLASGGLLADRPVARARAAVVTEEDATMWGVRGERLDFGPDALFFSRPFRDKPTHADWRTFLDELADLRRAAGLDLLVIDTLAAFLPAGAENIAEAMLAALRPLERLTSCGVAVLLLHHPRKGEAVAGQAPRGSGALGGYCDILVELRNLNGARPDDRRRRLVAWSRHEETPRELVVELSPDGRDYSAVTDVVDLAWEAGLEIVGGILARVGRQMTRRMLLDAWPDDRPPNEVTLWRWLERAVERGRLARHGAGLCTDPFRYSAAGRPSPWSWTDELGGDFLDALADRPSRAPATRRAAAGGWRDAARLLERLDAERTADE